MKKVFILGFLIAISSTASIYGQGSNTSKECSIDLFSADPVQVSPGGSAVLNWTTSNCSNVTIIGGDLTGYRPTSGNLTTGPLSGTTTFTLTAASATSTASRNITVMVQQPAAPPSSSIPPATTPVTTTTIQTPVPPPGTETTTTTVTTNTTPPAAPVPPPAAPVTTTTVITTPAPAVPVYDVSPRASINVNKLRFGAFVAPNMSWMKPTTATDDKNNFDVVSNGSKIGFTYGLMADYNFAPNYGIVTGLSINQTGGKIIATNKDQSISPGKVLKADFDYRLQYLDIPLALKLRTDDISGFRFFGQLGVSVGINLAKKADYTVTYVPDAPATSSRDTSGTKIKIQGGIGAIAPVMFQMNIGAGAEYPINNKLTFYVGLFFNNGFAPDATKPDLFNSSTLGYKGSFRDANTRLNNFALRVGLFF